MSTKERQDIRRPTSEEGYRILFQSIPLPVWVLSQVSLHGLAVNKAAIRYYGYSRAEFLRMTARKILFPSDLRRFLRYLQDPPRRRRSSVWRHRKKNGTLVEVEMFVENTLWEGKPATLIVVHDLTDRLSTEEAGEPCRAVGVRKDYKTVLLVEDNSRLRRVVGQYLKSEGYKILEASKPQTAMEMFRKRGKSVDLLLTDVAMPGMNGKELANRLLAYNRKMEVLFISGSSNLAVGLSPEELRNRVIRKPFRLSELARKVAQISNH